MKKENIFIFILLLLTISLTSCGMQDKNKTEISSNLVLDEIEPVKKSIGSLNIIVDPRIELLSAVQLQSGYELLTQFEFDYKNNMDDYFNNYKKHKAVTEFKRLNKLGFNYDAPPTSMLYLKNPPNLEQKIDFDEYLAGRANGKKNLTDFVQSLREFSKETDFRSFFDNNIPFYETMVEEVYNNVQDMNIAKNLDDYYGMDVNSYNIILAPMFHSGGYGPRVKGENGLYDIYGIIGPGDIRVEEDDKSIPVFSGETIRYIVWHEFSHSFVNPVTEKHLIEINKYNNLYSKISKIMKSQAYTTWEICVNEHIVRAVTTRLTYIHLGKAAGDQVLANEKKWGFYYIDALCKSLEDYENNRDTYPSFESYYPQLIKVFKELSEQELPDSFFKSDFTGPISSAFMNMDNMKIIIIVPTNEENQKSQEKIIAQTESIKKRFWTEAEIVEDIEALNRDLGDYIIVVYGTMEGNLWLDKYKDSFPFKIESDKIKADKVYEDTNLVLITAMPNPHNFENPLVIYTAQRAEDILRINEVFHGPTDYIIAKNYEEIYSGFYNKDKEKWTFQNLD